MTSRRPHDSLGQLYELVEELEAKFGVAERLSEYKFTREQQRDAAISDWSIDAKRSELVAMIKSQEHRIMVLESLIQDALDNTDEWRTRANAALKKD